jgi:hypothetical protein
MSDGDMHAEDDPATLEECRQKIERLREENEHLRQSANLFGDLAERLNLHDRRASTERRTLPRTGLDRRRYSGVEQGPTFKSE